MWHELADPEGCSWSSLSPDTRDDARLEYFLARLLDCSTARLLDWLDCPTARLPDCSTARLLDCPTARLPDWMRVAVEFRHPSWHQREVFELLERHQVAYCVVSGANLQCVLRATAPFVYVRLHGPDHEHLYGG